MQKRAVKTIKTRTQGKKMTTELILELLEKEKFIKIDDIAKKLFVSPSTVRRKLNELQAQGLIERIHGGAKISDEKNYFPKFSFRAHVSSLEKKKIALSALKLIKNGDVIFLDGSTSAFFVAEYLSQFDNIKVYTNAIDTLSLLAKNKVTVYSTGGLVSTENPSVLVGRYAENTISQIYADLAFFSAHSVNADGAITDCFEEEIPIRQAMIKNAKKSVFLCDSTKFNKTSAFHLCKVDDIDYLISDKFSEDNFNNKVKAQLISV